MKFMKIPNIIQIISNLLQSKNVKIIIVGGSVRDHFLKRPVKDYDIEVYGLTALDELIFILKQYGSVNLVGKSFGVLKFSYGGMEYDFSFPRKESKVAKGHCGFDVKVDGKLDFKTAARRRDFTVNALGYDVQSREFLDPFEGIKDIKEKKLRHIDSETFSDDPLRVYRAVQFSARFEYTLAKETLVLCRQMVKKNILNELPKERIYEEWKKLLLGSNKPSIGFELMRKLGILEKYFPELYALIGVPQSPKWHPEGDTWIHTMMSLDAMSKMCRSELLLFSNSDKQKLKFLFATLCHDLGKVFTTTIEKNGNIRAIGHEIAGLNPTKSLLFRLTNQDSFIQTLLPLVEHHLKPSQFYSSGAKSAAIRRLATKVNIEELVFVSRADFLGRSTEEALCGEYKAGDWLLDRAGELKVKTKALKCVVRGKDLMNLGFKPSLLFKSIMDEVYILQIDGKIASKEEAYVWIKKKYLKFKK